MVSILDFAFFRFSPSQLCSIVNDRFLVWGTASAYLHCSFQFPSSFSFYLFFEALQSPQMDKLQKHCTTLSSLDFFSFFQNGLNCLLADARELLAIFTEYQEFCWSTCYNHSLQRCVFEYLIVTGKCDISVIADSRCCVQISWCYSSGKLDSILLMITMNICLTANCV